MNRAISAFDDLTPRQIRTCPDCKKLVPHRRVVIKGGIIKEAWRPVKHCRRCNFVPEDQPRKPGGLLHVKDYLCEDHEWPCEPDSDDPVKCAECLRRKVCPRDESKPWCRDAIESTDGCIGAELCEGLSKSKR